MHVGSRWSGLLVEGNRCRCWLSRVHAGADREECNQVFKDAMLAECEASVK